MGKYKKKGPEERMCSPEELNPYRPVSNGLPQDTENMDNPSQGQYQDPE